MAAICREEPALGNPGVRVASEGGGPHYAVFERWMVVILDDSSEEGSLVKECIHNAGVSAVTLVKSMDELAYLISSDAEPFPNCLVVESAPETSSDREVITIIRNHKSSRVRNLPVVVVTRDNSFERFASWRDLGISGFFLKPVGVDTIRRCLLDIVCEQSKYIERQTTANNPLNWLATLWGVFTGPVADNPASERSSSTKIDIWS